MEIIFRIAIFSFRSPSFFPLIRFFYLGSRSRLHFFLKKISKNTYLFSEAKISILASASFLPQPKGQQPKVRKLLQFFDNKLDKIQEKSKKFSGNQKRHFFRRTMGKISIFCHKCSKKAIFEQKKNNNYNYAKCLENAYFERQIFFCSGDLRERGDEIFFWLHYLITMKKLSLIFPLIFSPIFGPKLAPDVICTFWPPYSTIIGAH